MDEHILEFSHVTKEYRDSSGRSLKAVNNVNLSVSKGECIGIVGESGSGKSTIAKMISHFTNVSSGRMIFLGKDYTRPHKRELKQYYQKVQMIFQDPLAAFSPRMKIGTYLSEPFINFKILRKKQALQFAGDLLAMVGLPREFVQRYPHELSGGELQRVVIARAIGLEPELIVCDECTSALDVTTQQKILELFVDLREKNNFSSVFITHDLAVAEKVCDRIYVMYQGEIVEELRGGNLIQEARHPYTKKLLSSVFSLEDFIEATETAI